MGRDGADSDYQREHGLDYWQGGEYNFPRGWEDDGKEDEKELVFNTFSEAKAWSIGNGGTGFTRNSNGHGFVPIIKGKK